LLKTVDLRDFIVYLKMEPNLIETLVALKKLGIRRAISTNRTNTAMMENVCHEESSHKGIWKATNNSGAITILDTVSLFGKFTVILPSDTCSSNIRRNNSCPMVDQKSFPTISSVHISNHTCIRAHVAIR